ncbi:CAP domain-containing protein [Clostridium oryzae]|uniref:SpoIVD-associated factor A n=1 Tax=Clostridium oryzae TaxID=1450648 RepID=A0A1V4IBL4_9CLOT|nr:CAP domain-containing protein [Clostridium oryzae]OPJ57392.1 SpoIVD-associated factor A [Clostridium oryzae]
MKKTMLLTLALVCGITTEAFAQDTIHTVQSGDTLWKIAQKYQSGISEIVAANPSISNPAIIYVGQRIKVPTMTDVKSQESEVLRLVNAERARAGVKPLTMNWQLERVARYKCQDMINKNYFSHTSPTYGSPFTMMQNFGIQFSAAGENIAKGQRSPAEVMNSWMNSPGHRSNILSGTYTQIGVGLAKDSSGTSYWTQMFIR